MSNITGFIRKHYLTCFVWGIMLVSTFFYFFLLPTHLHFGTDEANQSQIIKEIITKHSFPSVGPGGSIGPNIYHGAIYYYLYLIPGVVTWFNPLGFAVFTACLTLLSIYLLYRALLPHYGNMVALSAMVIYAFSFTLMTYGRWEWNPNTIPFFTVLSIIGLSKFLRGKQYFLVLFAFAIGMLTQLHITGYLFIPVLISMIVVLHKHIKDWKLYLWALCGFSIPWLPTLWYGFKTKFLMFRDLLMYFMHPSHTSLLHHAQQGWGVLLLFFNKVTALDQAIGIVVLITSISILGYWIYTKWNEQDGMISLYLGLILLFSFLMYAFYPGIVYIHYGEQLFPIFAILTALFFIPFFRYPGAKYIPYVVVLICVVLNMVEYNDQYIHGPEEYGTQNRVCATIHNKTKQAVTLIVNGIQKPSSFAYVCENNYGVHIGDHAQTTYILITNYKNEFILNQS